MHRLPPIEGETIKIAIDERILRSIDPADQKIFIRELVEKEGFAKECVNCEELCISVLKDAATLKTSAVVGCKSCRVMVAVNETGYCAEDEMRGGNLPYRFKTADTMAGRIREINKAFSGHREYFEEVKQAMKRGATEEQFRKEFFCNYTGSSKEEYFRHFVPNTPELFKPDMEDIYEDAGIFS